VGYHGEGIADAHDRCYDEANRFLVGYRQMNMVNYPSTRELITTRSTTKTAESPTTLDRPRSKRGWEAGLVKQTLIRLRVIVITTCFTVEYQHQSRRYCDYVTLVFNIDSYDRNL
jgi:hypothetical protein